MREGYIRTDIMERFNLKRGWFVTAYRIVDADDNDLVQPWMTSRRDAVETATELGIELHE